MSSKRSCGELSWSNPAYDFPYDPPSPCAGSICYPVWLSRRDFPPPDAQFNSRARTDLGRHCTSASACGPMTVRIMSPPRPRKGSRARSNDLSAVGLGRGGIVADARQLLEGPAPKNRPSTVRSEQSQYCATLRVQGSIRFDSQSPRSDLLIVNCDRSRQAVAVRLCQRLIQHLALVAYVLIRRLGYRLKDFAKCIGRDIAMVSSLISRYSHRIATTNIGEAEHPESRKTV